MPSVSALGQLLRSQHWPTHQLGRQRGPARAWTAQASSGAKTDMWTVDFKGHSLTGDCRRCDHLTVCDACSRFGLCVQVLLGRKLAPVQRVCA